MIGTIRPVLWEDNKKGKWIGLTDNYIRVKVTSEQDLHNRIDKVLITKDSNDYLSGSILQ